MKFIKNDKIKFILELIKKHKYILLIFSITTILLSNVIISPKYSGHDTYFHVGNMIELSKTISLNNLLGDNIIQYNFFKFGYGTWLFYPKLPHLLGAYLYLIFDNIYISMKIIYFITTFLSGLIMFNLSQKVFNNKKLALISSVVYLTIPYHMCEITIRDAFAENFMFMAIPLIFLGLYHLKDNEYKSFYLNFILGYLIGMHSHLISMVYCTILVALFILYHYKCFFKKEKIKALIISTIIVTGISLPFLTTVIEHKLLDSYTVFLSDAFTNRDFVLETVKDFKYLYNQKYIENSIILFFSYTTIILFIITTIQLIFKKNNKYKKEQKMLLVFIIILITLITSRVIWEHAPDILLMIQFTWRLMIFLSLFVSLYIPSCLLNIKNNKKIVNIIFSLLIILFLIEGMTNIKFYSEVEYAEGYILKDEIVMGYQREYLPLVTNNDEMEEYNNILYYEPHYFRRRNYDIKIKDNSAKVKIIEEDFPSITFEITNLEEKTTIELPRIYYLGYTLKDEEGNKIEPYMNERGFIQADISENGKYYFAYTNTLAEKIANIISIITIVSVITYVVKRCKK